MRDAIGYLQDVENGTRLKFSPYQCPPICGYQKAMREYAIEETDRFNKFNAEETKKMEFETTNVIVLAQVLL